MGMQIVDLLRRPNLGKVLSHLGQNGPSRFSDVKRSTRLASTQVDRALDALVRSIWVEARTEGGDDGSRMRYAITREGQQQLDFLNEMHAWTHRRRKAPARELDRELEAILT